MRVAVIGTGVAGRSHLLDLVTSDAFDVVAVCARRSAFARDAAEVFGVPSYYEDWRELLSAEQPAGLVLATPPTLTAEILAAPATHPLWVLAEKPAGVDRATLAEAQTRRGAGAARVCIAYNRRYQPHVRAARQLLRRGHLGHLVRVDCTWRSSFFRRYTAGETFRQQSPVGDGVLLDTASHIIDTLLFLGMVPGEVTRARVATRGAAADVEAELALRAGDVAIHLSIIDDADVEDDWTIVMRGRRGQFHMTKNELVTETPDTRDTQDSGPADRPVDDLLRMADGAPPHGASLSEAVAVLSVIDAARDRAGLRRWERPRAKALGRLNGSC
jgi:predicted dehydrogenase